MIVEFFDRIEEVAVEGHQATDSGTNNLVVVRRSVRVHPWGGVILSAWLAQREYPYGSAGPTISSSHTALSV